MMPTVASRESSLRRVALQQLRLIDMNKRAPLLLAILSLPTVMWRDAMVNALLPVAPILLATLAWPLLVWQGQGPSQRNYHRALPIDQVTHDLLKVGAGAVWLFSGIALTAALLASIAAVLPTPFPTITLPMLLNAFTGALIIYLLASVIPILTDRPLEWLLGICGVLAAAGILRGVYDENFISDLIGLFIRGEYGLGMALMGGYSSGLMGDRVGMYYPWANVTAFNWSIATVLWLSFAIWLVCWASRRANSRETS
jgi:hypothetical protein